MPLGPATSISRMAGACGSSHMTADNTKPNKLPQEYIPHVHDLHALVVPRTSSRLWHNPLHTLVQSLTWNLAMLQKPGVAGYFGAKDVPGGNDMGAVVHDEECFASEVVTCIGQPIGVVVADTEQHARMAARLVKVEYQDLPPLISIEDAIEASSYYEVNTCSWFICVV